MKTVLLLSGGLDSSVLLRLLLKENREVHPLFMDIGQTSYPEERSAAMSVCNGICELTQVSIREWRKAVPGPFDMLKVPRNALLSLLAVPYALAWNCDKIALGSNEDDAKTSDSTSNFYAILNTLLGFTQKNVTVEVPFLMRGWGKVEIIKWALNECGSHFVEKTYSCYAPRNGKPCGSCSGCIMRNEALVATASGAKAQ